MLIYINFIFGFLGLDKLKFILKITSPMNSYKINRFFKPAPRVLYLIKHSYACFK
jgi:hypothetical protein